MSPKDITDKNELRRLINKRINSIIGLSLQSLEDNLLPNNKEKYEKLRYDIMKFCNDISRKLEIDLELFDVKKKIYRYYMPYSGDNDGGF